MFFYENRQAIRIHYDVTELSIISAEKNPDINYATCSLSIIYTGFLLIALHIVSGWCVIFRSGILPQLSKDISLLVANNQFMRKHYLLSIILIVTYSASGQNLQLDIHGNKLGDFIRLEQSLGSLKREKKSTYISDPGVAQPEIYQRKEAKIPDMLSYYFYYKKDSVINYILYEWDEINFTDSKSNTAKTNEEIRFYIEKYNQLYDQVAAKYGKSKRKGDINNIALADEGMTRKDNWDPNDSTEIEMFITLSNKYEQNGAITKKPTYRIRLYIRNKKIIALTAPRPLSEERVKSLDSISQAFFSAMKIKNFEEAKLYLSTLISNNITDSQLERLSQSVRFQDKMEIFFKGVQSAMDGSAFFIVQYQYSNETINPPKEMIKIVFDENNKIAGIQPLTKN